MKADEIFQKVYWRKDWQALNERLEFGVLDHSQRLEIQYGRNLKEYKDLYEAYKSAARILTLAHFLTDMDDEKRDREIEKEWTRYKVLYKRAMRHWK